MCCKKKLRQLCLNVDAAQFITVYPALHFLWLIVLTKGQITIDPDLWLWKPRKSISGILSFVI